MMVKAALVGIAAVLASFRVQADPARIDAVIDIFGIPLFIAQSVSEADALNRARLLAGYLDNDRDGAVDDELLLDTLIEEGAHLKLAAERHELTEMQPPLGADSRAAVGLTVDDEAHGALLRMIYRHGLAKAYPEQFGDAFDSYSELTRCMDNARGGRFEQMPDLYPTEAWYTVYGNRPQIQVGAVATDMPTMREALDSERWGELMEKLAQYVHNFQQKLVPARGRLQL